MAKEKKCEDPNCAIHNSLKTRGRSFKGTVVSAKATKTASVVWERVKKVTKYERYEKKKTKVQVHNPSCIDAKEGDYVEIKECRPLSKTKKFVVVGFAQNKQKEGKKENEKIKKEDKK